MRQAGRSARIVGGCSRSGPDACRDAFDIKRPVQVDPGLALGLLWIVAVLVVDNSSHPHVAVIPAALHSTTRWLVVACAIVVALAALALRHRQPLAALFVVVAAIVAAPAVLLLLGPALVALYTVAITLGRRDTAIAAVGVVAAFVLQRAAWGLTGDNSLPTVLIGTVASAGLGLYAGVRRESARERTAFEQRQEALEAERTVAEERVRIARELHDVVAHTLSLIIVQSEVLRTKLVDEEPRAGAGGDRRARARRDGRAAPDARAPARRG